MKMTVASSLALRVALGATLVAAVPIAARGQDAEKGAALMADARKAIGGDDRLRAVKSVQSSGKFKRSQGNNTLEGDFEVFIELPAKYRRNETTGTAGGPIAERIEVMNGIDAWQEVSNGFPAGGFGGGRGGGRGFGGGDGGGRGDGGGGRFGAEGRAIADAIAAARGDGQPSPERLREVQLRQRQNEVARLMLMWFLTTDAPVTWVGTAESPDGTADVLEVRPTEGTPTRVFLDSKTHMPLMMTTTGFGGGVRGRRGGGGTGAPAADGRGPAPGTGEQGAPAPAPAGTPGPEARRGGGRGPQQPITIETHLSEYKAVGGVKLPHLITRGINGQTNEEWEIKNYRVNPNIKASTFTK
jgi:outer membrane lipoprotein-sorting protein